MCLVVMLCAACATATDFQPDQPPDETQDAGADVAHPGAHAGAAAPMTAAAVGGAAGAAIAAAGSGGKPVGGASGSASADRAASGAGGAAGAAAVAGSAGAAGVAGASSSAAGANADAGAAGSPTGEAGQPAPTCPDADADGTCDVDDVCPAGSDEDADQNGHPDACERVLWQISQQDERSYTFPADRVAARAISVSVTGSGANCATDFAGVGLGYDVVANEIRTGITVDTSVTRTHGDQRDVDALSTCTEFSLAYMTDRGDRRALAPVHHEQTRIAYFSVHAFGRIRSYSGSYQYLVNIETTWTAHGY
jgi:hypothetical protein